MIIPDHIRKTIENKLGQKILSNIPVSGGCINNACKLVFDNDSSLFLKFNQNSSEDMFITEAHGLEEIKKSSTIDIPEVVLYNKDFILMKFINPGKRNKNFFEDFGMKFASMHKFTSDQFGFYEDNYIGATPQKNIPSDEEKKSWVSFYFNKRLKYQFYLSEQNGYATDELKKGMSVIENKIEKIFDGSETQPSLLHGDLWSGNFIINTNGEVCLIDPAVYYGDREADLAMTKLFGGFNSDFYEAYKDHFPLAEGYDYRENIYKLYHFLNHLNIFGSGYYSQAMNLIKYYL